ncbi:MAG: CoA transferase [Phenylobacterium sp.]|uniref:CaiB/BaiF CoA transferase family protein n=1 Tax=Phenylobacterium sp. TaxID=1871053 RepID=UPI0025D1D5A5|nr:CoA transferase [Phenylobacterium sp.]MCA3711916.1 CoA transferase [Phenylobacterium sp.]MCA3729596.1 CoA transferase [Phenylobacterium sp.]MCA3745421.1 CoA transferase [Phenylobacterium sp.]MCA3751152.1 CoA transferase [Phenylobacterium sp.]MCA4916470.1 CoA transferase [Phenylobacterium sp.]
MLNSPGPAAYTAASGAETRPSALSGVRICDFSGQLAGAGATKWLAAFGAEVIRVEDPARNGLWDIFRGNPPYVDERRGIEFGGGFNNHNTDKLGVTINVRTERGKELLTELIRQSDVVTENFAAGVLERWGFSYDTLKSIKPDIIYVSNCGFGHVGPYRSFKTWGPIVQAVSGLTFASGLPGLPPAGWGYSYMDHTGGHYMVMAIMMALIHHRRTGEGQWVDLACSDSALPLNGPSLLDWTVNGRPSRREGQPNSNRNHEPPMAPHGIYPCQGDDAWVAIACRGDEDWSRLSALIGEPWSRDAGLAGLEARLGRQDLLDEKLAAWTAGQGKFEVQARLRAAGVPCSAVQTPEERIDHDPDTVGLWPEVVHSAMGRVRVDGLPVRMSRTPWRMERGAPCLGEHNEAVFGRLLGLSTAEVASLKAEGVV